MTNAQRPICPGQEEIQWRLGVEVELLAPLGRSRYDLALAIARAQRGCVRRFFHPQSEPSKVPGTSVFHNLTLGFEVANEGHQWIARCVDDLTLQADLQVTAPPQPGWYRIVSDDQRLLRLIQQQADPECQCADVLSPIARLFGTTPYVGTGGMVRVDDLAGASVAVAAPLPGERERLCEVISAPLVERHREHLENLLGPARALGFTPPLEGATHLHFDATRLQSAPAMANLIGLLSTYGETLRKLLGTNSHCRRLGPWPPALLQMVATSDFRNLSWGEARARLAEVELTKFCDFNLLNCIHDRCNQNTIEVRILPVWLESGPILAAAGLFEAIFHRALQLQPLTEEGQKTPRALLDLLKLSPGQRAYWSGLPDT